MEQTNLLPLKPPSERSLEGINRIIAVGDLHGDLNIFQDILRRAGCIDQQNEWIAPPGTVVLQLGDQLDDQRPGIGIGAQQESQLLDYWDYLAQRAHWRGSALWAVYGNHELVNMLGDPAYVEQYTSLVGRTSFGPNRQEAFAPGGEYARRLARTRQVMIRLGPYLFVHGGLTYQYARRWTIEETNQVFDEWVQGQPSSNPQLLSILLGDSPEWPASDHPLWSRAYSQMEQQADTCSMLEMALALYQAHVMIVGHTPQEEGINCACQCMAIRADVGNSVAFGSQFEAVRGQYLEITIVSPQEYRLNPINVGQN